MNATTARAAFLAGRRQYIGGTDIAAITGLSSWATPLSVYLDKTTPAADDGKDSLIMRRGLALEDFISDEFTRAMPGLVTYRPKPIVRTDWGFPAGASVDRLIAKAEHPRTPVAVLECKTAFRDGWRTWDEERLDLPDSYFAQVQWYLAVTGLPIAYGAADVGDDRLRIVPIEADARIAERLITAGREFWQEHVERGVPPEPQGTRADAEALNRLYAETVPEPPVYIDDELAETLVAEYLKHKAVADEAQKAADLAKQRLQSLMGEHEQAVVVGSLTTHLIAWKTQTRRSLDTKRLRAERPEIADEYVKESTTRVFAQPKEIDS